jgi:hypothetical protein
MVPVTPARGLSSQQSLFAFATRNKNAGRTRPALVSKKQLHHGSTLLAALDHLLLHYLLNHAFD